MKGNRMSNLLECQDFVCQIPDNTLAELDGVLVTVRTVVHDTDGQYIIHYSPEDNPSWKMAVYKPGNELVTTFVPITW